MLLYLFHRIEWIKINILLTAVTILSFELFFSYNALLTENSQSNSYKIHRSTLRTGKYIFLSLYVTKGTTFSREIYNSLRMPLSEAIVLLVSP